MSWQDVVKQAMTMSDMQFRLPINQRRRHRTDERLDKIGFWCLWFLTRDLDK